MEIGTAKLIRMLEDYLPFVGDNAQLTVTIYNKSGFYVNRLPVKRLFVNKLDGNSPEVELTAFIDEEV